MLPNVRSIQRSFDDLGTPLSEVTFVVIDLETTGASPDSCAITEVGALKLRGGECLGTLETLVNPGVPIPPEITYLTGINEAMVLPAPLIEAVLPALLEFIGGAVIVGHNVRFDLSFLNAALGHYGYPALRNSCVDTCALARRLVREEVPNCRLGTLAAHFRTARRPNHRAFADAAATGELLHCLLERAGTLGVLGLDDLLELPTIQAHPQLGKLKLTSSLPRRPGVYLFRDAGGRVLYVGKAVDLRRRVRSYFSGGGDERRKVGPLLRELAAIDHVVCRSELEASVTEVRLIHHYAPRYNRQANRWRRYAYVKLTLDERFPRLSIVRSPRSDDGCVYVGPLASAGLAKLVTEAVETVVPLRRCTGRPGRGRARDSPCTPAQLGVATCPCAGAISEQDYREIVTLAARGLSAEPPLLLTPLISKMRTLAAEERFEEAAAVRDRAGALARALARQQRLHALRHAGRMTVAVPGEGGAVLADGRLLEAWGPSEPGPGLLAGGLEPEPEPSAPVPREVADEMVCVSAWLDARAGQLRLIECEGGLAWPLPRLPRLQPARAK
jgi:DNA polymerase-3 subunit epsilon